MPSPACTLRQMIETEATFDRRRVHSLCLLVTATMQDRDEAARLYDLLWDEMEHIELAIGMESPARSVSAWRQHALNALDRMVKAAG